MREHTDHTTENPKGLGVTACTCCGGDVEAIGPLLREGEYAGYCSYCAHDMQGFDLLDTEAADLLRTWFNTRVQHVPATQLKQAVDNAIDMLTTESSSDAAQA